MLDGGWDRDLLGCLKIAAGNESYLPQMGSRVRWQQPWGALFAEAQLTRDCTQRTGCASQLLLWGALYCHLFAAPATLRRHKKLVPGCWPYHVNSSSQLSAIIDSSQACAKSAWSPERGSGTLFASTQLQRGASSVADTGLGAAHTHTELGSAQKSPELCCMKQQLTEGAAQQH